REEQDAALARVFGEPAPPFLGKLHSLPVVVARFVLLAELHAERLGRRAFGGGNVGLKFHGIRTGVRDGIDKGVREPEAAVVCQRDLSDDETASGAETSDGGMRHDGEETGCRVSRGATPGFICSGSSARRSSPAKR